MKMEVRAVVVGVALAAVSGVACAQFGGLAGKLGLSGGSGSVTPDQIVSKYVGSLQSVNQAEVNMLRAMGQNEEADKIEPQTKDLADGATQEALEAATKLQTETSKSLEGKLKETKVQMDEVTKKQFSDSARDLARGLTQHVNVGTSIKGFKPGPTALGASTMSTLYVMKSLPDTIKVLGNTLKGAVVFAKNNNIVLPKEVQDAIGLLG